MAPLKHSQYSSNCPPKYIYVTMPIHTAVLAIVLTVFRPLWKCVWWWWPLDATQLDRRVALRRAVWIGLKSNRKSYALYQMVMFTMTLGDPEIPKPTQFLHFSLPFTFLGLPSNLLSTDARCLVIILCGQCNMVHFTWSSVARSIGVSKYTCPYRKTVVTTR